MLVKSFGTPSTDDTSIKLSRCGEDSFQVALGGLVGYHRKTSKEVRSIGVYIEVRHESVHVVVGSFFGADVCMHIADLVPVRALVGKVTKLLELEALELAKVSKFSLAIVGMRFAAGSTIVIILRKDDGTRGCI